MTEGEWLADRLIEERLRPVLERLAAVEAEVERLRVLSQPLPPLPVVDDCDD